LTHRILIVDDDLHIREVIRVALKKAGMTVFEARDGKEALTRFTGDRPDLIILDIGMPEFDGLDVCREIRKSSDVPILFLSARDDEIDRVLGLEIGGDDYVTKPFSPRELIARVGAVLRRVRPALASEQLSYGDIELDAATHKVRRGGTSVALGPTEYRLLRHFLQHPGRVFSREKLLDSVWPHDSDIELRTVDVHIRRLRKALNEGGRPDIIRTVRSAGYALDVEG
jgi:two-component system, OmpR family, phosphate regulon response regulator PhoB